jgi:hypothetical protein
MILSHQKQKNSYVPQHQQQRSSRSITPTAPPIMPVSTHLNQLNHHQHHQTPQQFPSYVPTSKSLSKPLTNQPPTVTTAIASTFFPPIQQTPLQVNGSSSNGNQFGGLASSSFNSKSSDTTLKSNSSSSSKSVNSSFSNKKSHHHNNSTTNNGNNHHGHLKDSSKSHSSTKPRSRSRSRSPLNHHHQQQQQLSHRSNHTNGLINNNSKSEKDLPMLPHHLQATEAAITAAAQQHILMDKYRQELMRLGGAASIPPAHLANMMMGLPPGLIPPPSSSTASSVASHFPLNLPPLNSNSGQTRTPPPPLSPLVFPPSNLPSSSSRINIPHTADTSLGSTLSPKSLQAKMLQSMPANMSETEFLRIMATMSAAAAANVSNMHLQQGHNQLPMQPPPLASSTTNTKNGLPQFLQQFFENMPPANSNKNKQPPLMTESNRPVSPKKSKQSPVSPEPSKVNENNDEDSLVKNGKDEKSLNETQKKEDDYDDSINATKDNDDSRMMTNTSRDKLVIDDDNETEVTPKYKENLNEKTNEAETENKENLFKKTEQDEQINANDSKTHLNEGEEEEEETAPATAIVLSPVSSINSVKENGTNNSDEDVSSLRSTSNDEHKETVCPENTEAESSNVPNVDSSSREVDIMVDSGANNLVSSNPKMSIMNSCD